MLILKLKPYRMRWLKEIYILLEVEPGGREHCVWFIVTVELKL